jgi:putative transcriptional regulator
MAPSKDRKGSLMNNSLKGTLLIATPSMSDPRFHKSMIFVCSHDENGAMGLVINNILPGLAFENMIEHFQIPIAKPEKVAQITVLGGGPVETARGFIIHKSDYQLDDTIQISDDYAITGTVDALKAVARGEGPEPMLFILGYAGWSEGQLERELQENAWLTAEPDDSLLFEVPAEQKWKMGLSKLGIEPGFLSAQAGRA